MGKKETMREAVERYARENAYRASSKTLTGNQFADTIRLRFAGDRRMEALQKAFRQFCNFVRQNENGTLEASYVWDNQAYREVGDIVFSW